MLRKIGLSLLCITASLTANVYAMQGMSMTFSFIRNKPQPITNYSYGTKAADCIINTEDESDELLVRAIAKKGTINGVELSTGNSLVLTVYAGEIMKLVGESGAKIEITNYGQNTVKATCMLTSSK
jgi:Trk K+ transport system NAD-binding subunit